MKKTIYNYIKDEINETKLLTFYKNYEKYGLTKENRLSEIINTYVKLYEEDHPYFYEDEPKDQYISTSELLLILLNQLLEQTEENSITLIEKYSKITAKKYFDLKYIKANKSKGYNIDGFLYIPNNIKKKYLIIETLKGTAINKQQFLSQLSSKHPIIFFAEHLNCPILIPLLPYSKNDEENPRNLGVKLLSITDEDNKLYRLDRQIINMIDEAKEIVKEIKNIKLNEKNLLYGYEESASVASKLAFFHPKKFEAVYTFNIKDNLLLPQSNEGLEDYKKVKKLYEYTINRTPAINLNEAIMNEILMNDASEKEIQPIINKKAKKKIYANPESIKKINDAHNNLGIKNYKGEDLLTKSILDYPIENISVSNANYFFYHIK